MTLHEQADLIIENQSQAMIIGGGIIQPQLRLDIEDLLREYVALIHSSSLNCNSASVNPTTEVEHALESSHSPSQHSNISNDIEQVMYCTTASPSNSEKQSNTKPYDCHHQLSRSNSSSTIEDTPLYSKAKIGKTKRRKKNKFPGESEFKLWTWM